MTEPEQAPPKRTREQHEIAGGEAAGKGFMAGAEHLAGSGGAL
jgi:hypothetical protein